MFNSIKLSKKLVAAGAVLASAVLSSQGVFAAEGETSGSGGTDGNASWNHGNNNAGMSIYTYGHSKFIHNRNYSSGSGTYGEVWGYAGLTADGKFLKSNYRVFEVRNYTNPRRYTPTSWRHHGNVNVKVMGKSVVNETKTESNKEDTDIIKSYDLPSYTFFSAKATFTVGPIPVTLKGSLRGEAGVAAKVTNDSRDWSSLYYDGFTTEVKPEVALIAKGSADVFAGAVEGIANIDIIRANNRTWSDQYRVRYKNNPASRGVRYYGTTFNTSTLSTGGGNLKIKLLWGLGSSTLAKWSGYTISSSTYWNKPYSEYFAYTAE